MLNLTDLTAKLKVNTIKYKIYKKKQTKNNLKKISKYKYFYEENSVPS